MKKHLLILTILASCGNLLSAQPTTPAQTSLPFSTLPRWTISVSAGGAFPAGKFGSQKAYDSTSSFARTGPLVSLGLDYRFGAHYGLSLIISGQENATDNQAIIKQLEGFRPDILYTTVNIGKWEMGRALAGGWVEKALDKKQKWSLHIRLATGVLTTKPPKSVINTVQGPGGITSGPNFTNLSLTYPKSLWAFAWQADAGLKYTLTRRWSFHLDAGYAASSVSVYSIYHRSFETAGSPGGTFTLGTGTITGMSSPPLQTFKLPVNTVNLSAGAGLSF
jgi:hypothetical protein